jgi:multicomponent Na+:H+ antiporter subunit C
MIEIVLALVIGILYGSGVYLLLRRNLLKFILALGLISNATHLLIFTGAGLTRGAPPLIGEGTNMLTQPYADPLPQALILTAIVISFGLTAFTILLVYRTHKAMGTDDPEALVNTDAPPPYKPYPVPEPNLPSLAQREKGSEPPPTHGTQDPDPAAKTNEPPATKQTAGTQETTP